MSGVKDGTEGRPISYEHLLAAVGGFKLRGLLEEASKPVWVYVYICIKDEDVCIRSA
jgi:hypothetical protein